MHATTKITIIKKIYISIYKYKFSSNAVLK